MKNPNPVNLQTSKEVRERGWQAESRDADGHLTSCHAPIEADDAGIAKWIVECTGSGQTVTFWPAVGPLPPSSHKRVWQDMTNEIEHSGVVALGDRLSGEMVDAWQEFVYALPAGKSPDPAHLFYAGYAAALASPAREPVAYTTLAELKQVRSGYYGRMQDDANDFGWNIPLYAAPQPVINPTHSQVAGTPGLLTDPAPADLSRGAE